MARSTCPSLPPSAVPPTIVTTSSCTTETARGTHLFRVHQYSLLKGLGVGNSVRSGTFDVGGYSWALRLYPSGIAPGSEASITVLVDLVSPDAEATAQAELGLVNLITGGSLRRVAKAALPFFLVSTKTLQNNGAVAAATSFFRSDLEAPSSPYLRDDHLAIGCTITVVREPRVTEARLLPRIEVPPPGMPSDLGKLLEDGEWADVTLHVREEAFPAHRAVLVARSSVFKAVLCGTTKEKESGHVTIKDMQPAVFRAFLCFVYMDALPSMEDLDGNDRTEMLRHLLVAADRYAVERLKRLCESLLCGTLDKHTVRSTLALAIRHHCHELRMACIQFLASDPQVENSEPHRLFLNKLLFG